MIHLINKYNITQLFGLIIDSGVKHNDILIETNQSDKLCKITVYGCCVDYTYQQLIDVIKNDIKATVICNVIKKDGDWYSKLEFKLILK